MLVAQFCLTLCSPLDSSLLGSSVHGILQARILEWIAIPFSRVSCRPRGQTPVSCIVGKFFTSWVTRKETSALNVPIAIGVLPLSGLFSALNHKVCVCMCLYLYPWVYIGTQGPISTLKDSLWFSPFPYLCLSLTVEESSSRYPQKYVLAG